MTNRAWEVGGALGACLIFASLGRAQTAQGNINVGNTPPAAPSSVLPFTCNVDTLVFPHIADCVNFSPMTTTNTSTTNFLDTNWHTFEIFNVVTAGPTNNVTFLIDGVQVGPAIATNIPIAGLTPTFVIKNTEPFAKLMDVDAFKLWMAVTR